MNTPATAALPVIAALCGTAVPAALYAAAIAAGGSMGGWAAPTATDIAFALAVLAAISTHLPTALRAFLLTLAVVDDLGAILVIESSSPRISGCHLDYGKATDTSSCCVGERQSASKCWPAARRGSSLRCPGSSNRSLGMRS